MPAACHRHRLAIDGSKRHGLWPASLLPASPQSAGNSLLGGDYLRPRLAELLD